MNTRFRSKMFELGIKRAAPSRGLFLQEDPKSGKYRGIVREVGEDNAINWVPEKPIIGRNKQEVVAAFAKRGYGDATDEGTSSPWHASTSMPFDLQGNRLHV